MSVSGLEGAGPVRQHAEGSVALWESELVILVTGMENYGVDDILQFKKSSTGSRPSHR